MDCDTIPEPLLVKFFVSGASEVVVLFDSSRDTEKNMPNEHIDFFKRFFTRLAPQRGAQKRTWRHQDYYFWRPGKESDSEKNIVKHKGETKSSSKIAQTEAVRK